MANDRKPDVHVKNPRGPLGHMYDQVKSAWKKANHVLRATTTVTKDPKTGEEQTKTRVRLVPRDDSVSLKEFARSKGGDAGKRWLDNKRANTSKPPLGLGRTRKKRTGNNQPKKASPGGKEQR